MSSITRRRFCQLTALAAGGVVSPGLAIAAPEKISVKTYTYKTAGRLPIKLDVHRADDNVVRPAVVWIHGGALIMGGRQGIDRRVKKAMLDAGYAIISLDYRLAPETLLPAIIEDLEDAFKWIHKEGPDRLNVRTDRLAVMGGSAGGYMTLTAGFRVEPRPAVLVSFWGYGDLVGKWYSEPSPHPRHQRSKMTAEQASKLAEGPPIANSRDRKGNGGAFYQHCRQRGIWPKYVSGFDPHTDAKKFYPYMAVKNVTADYPPTVLIHGTEDTDVPFEQSVMMAREFEKHDVPHKFLSLKNGEHGLAGADPKKISEAYATAFEFVKRQVEV